MTRPEYWIAASGSKSFALFKKNEMGMVSRIGIYRTFKKAEAVMNSLINPTPHIEP